VDAGIFLSASLNKSKRDAIWEVLTITITSWNLIEFEINEKYGRQSV